MKAGASRYGGWLLAAVGLHAAILFARWQLLVSDPSYAVAARESIELNLIESAPAAAAAEAPPPSEPAPAIPEPVVQEPPPPTPLLPPEPTPPSREEPPPKSTPPPKPPVPRPRSANAAVTNKPHSNPVATGNTATAPSGTSSGGAGNSKAAYLFNPHPPYPPASKQAGEQGTVLLAVAINESGGVTSVSVKQSSGFPRLDQAARAGVAGWRFRPARLAGLPVAAQIEVPVRFRLSD